MLRERALKVVLLLLGVLFSAAILPVIGGIRDPGNSDTGDTHDDGPIFCHGCFPAHRGAKPICASQLDQENNRNKKQAKKKRGKKRKQEKK